MPLAFAHSNGLDCYIAANHQHLLLSPYRIKAFTWSPNFLPPVSLCFALAFVPSRSISVVHSCFFLFVYLLTLFLNSCYVIGLLLNEPNNKNRNRFILLGVFGMRKIHMFANADFSVRILYFAFFCSPSRCLFSRTFQFVCVCACVFFSPCSLFFSW